MMVGMPIFAPRGNLEGPEPPHIHAGVFDALFGVSEMREAIDEALHVQRVDQADRTYPKETHPTKTKQKSREDREHDDGRFQPAPGRVHAAGQFRSPPLFIRSLSLIEPTHVGPPETALLRRRNVIGCVCYGMMQPVVSNPTCGMSGAVEDRPEYQNLLDYLIDLKGLVRQQAVIADRSAKPAESNE